MRTTSRPSAVTLAGLLLAALTACAGGDESGDADPSGSGPAGSAGTVAFDQALHDELVRMQADDQAELTGQGEDPETTFEERQVRLAEIFDEHGWPGWALVGREGSTAAWVVAQHADLDPELQRRALDLLAEAVAADDASHGDLAYLTDRVAAAEGKEQTYGTQIRCDGAEAVPATPIGDQAGVDERRAEAGLDPLRDYVAEMEKLCASDAE
ncbi:DUF6624 domain-containing protein [Nocardioides iriomotensis]|uniref:Lipoprotein n=1 Tax=Nocardioides iriomotensis TaxID=715784 RepID=A0A4Q5J3Q8_9ACTN|nr:DUF6624 domain-containing protein [Nocardioides iriomotensis]RYU12045.1 hypothetical protein ETU37_12390 [Nocardioides iriomotensis]